MAKHPPHFYNHTRGSKGICGRCTSPGRDVSWSVAFRAWLCIACREMVTEYILDHGQPDTVDMLITQKQPSNLRDDPCGGGPIRDGGAMS